MDNLDQKNSEDLSLLADLGENYQYLKTIINNRVEILKLEFLQNIQNIGGILLLMILGLFFSLIVFSLLVAAAIVFVESFTGSYLSSILLVNLMIIFLGVSLYLFLKPKLSDLLKRKMLNFINDKPND